MFSQFLISSGQTQASNRTVINELKEAIKAINRSSTQSLMGSESMETPVPIRFRGSRRSSMFFGISQLPSTPQLTVTLLVDTPFKSNIQVLQADIVYDKELKVSSLEGLQYLARQLQLLSSKYPGREIKMAHMVSYNLRPHVVASWNSYRYREYLITGLESNEIMVEDWLSLSNSEVQAIEATYKRIVLKGTHPISRKRNPTNSLYNHRELLQYILRPINEVADQLTSPSRSYV